MNGLHIPLAAALTVYAITVCCSACLQLFLKIKLNSDCLVGGGTSAINTHIADSALVFAALSFIANVACLLFRTRSERGWALARSICTRWQPLYFLIVSLQKLVFSAIIVQNVVDSRRERVAGTCSIALQDENKILAAVLLWSFATFFTGISVILGDLDEELLPLKRKCSYCFFVLCSTLDAIGSYFWGNSLAKQVSISVGSFNFVIDNQITSCMTSVLAISIHFLFVSARSQTGRAWSYAPLRFELVLSDESELTNSSPAHAADHHLLTEAAKSSEDLVCEELRGTNAKNCNPCFYMGKFLGKIQQKNTSRCQVFSIPCTTNRDMGSSSPGWFEAKRPFFNLIFLRPLHRLAVAHPNCYIGFAALTAFASFGCSFLRDFALGGMLCFFLNSFAFILGLGFFSCKRHNLDRVAALSIVRSFRFLLITALLLAFFGLQVRFAHLGIKSPWQAAAIGILAFPFCLCALSDCSPSVSAFTQICISVSVPHLLASLGAEIS